MDEYGAKPYHGLRKFAEHLFIYAFVISIIYLILYIFVLLGYRLIGAI
jgi:hypothetical protein